MGRTLHLERGVRQCGSSYAFLTSLGSACSHPHRFRSPESRDRTQLHLPSNPGSSAAQGPTGSACLKNGTRKIQGSLFGRRRRHCSRCVSLFSSSNCDSSFFYRRAVKRRVKLYERETFEHTNFACNERDHKVFDAEDIDEEADDIVAGHISKAKIPVFPPFIAKRGWFPQLKAILYRYVLGLSQSWDS